MKQVTQKELINDWCEVTYNIFKTTDLDMGDQEAMYEALWNKWDLPIYEPECLEQWSESVNKKDCTLEHWKEETEHYLVDGNYQLYSEGRDYNAILNLFQAFNDIYATNPLKQ